MKQKEPPIRNFFELGIQEPEELSNCDFRQCPLLANCFVYPTKDALIAAIPVKSHLNVITLRPPIVQITDQLLTVPKSESHVFNHDLIRSDEFWMRPSVETAEIISKLPFSPFPVIPNVFIYDNRCTNIITFAHIVGDKAYCLHWPAKALRPL